MARRYFVSGVSLNLNSVNHEKNILQLHNAADEANVAQQLMM